MLFANTQICFLTSDLEIYPNGLIKMASQQRMEDEDEMDQEN